MGARGAGGGGVSDARDRGGSGWSAGVMDEAGDEAGGGGGPGGGGAGGGGGGGEEQ